MAYKKTYKKRGTFRRKRVNPGVKALRIVKSLQKAVEVKSNRVEFDAITSYNGTIVPFHHGIQVGSNRLQRIGDYIKPFRLSGRMSISMGPDTETRPATASVRIIFFRFIRDNNVQPAVFEYLQQADSPFNYYLASKNPENKHQWITLYDKIHRVSPGTYSTKDIFINLRLRGETQYVQNDEDEVEMGGIYMLALSDVDPTTSPPVVSMVSQLFFTDS